MLAEGFFPFKGTEGYLWLLRQIVTQYGIPLFTLGWQVESGRLRPKFRSLQCAAPLPSVDLTLSLLEVS
jgi:hypothetical protein